MEFEIRDDKQFDRETVRELFLSVQWESAEKPDELVLAFANSHSVFSAWSGDRLVGLCSVVSDGHMAAYIPYALVRPEWQGQGVGRALMHAVAARYAGLTHKTLISYADKTGFYERCGFERGADKVPMFLCC